MGTERETVVSERSDAPWLPRGGRALVVRGGRPQTPMCLVRLLLRCGDRAFCIPRDGFGKLDLPTRAVALGDPDGKRAVAELVADVTGVQVEARFVGAVRNVVYEADEGYPWPTPLAHFGVWATTAPPRVPGSWLSVDGRQSSLHDRHWFPLLRREGPRSR